MSRGSRSARRATGPSVAATTAHTHIALVGFMGAGKSTIGRVLAERIGYNFADLDQIISKNAGQSIPEIFREHGEVGFRARERAALRALLAEPKPLVIATGGGTFVDSSMREWLQQSARTVFLEADVQTLMARIGQGKERASRPLLAGPDPEMTIKRLLKERRPAYLQSDFTVKTDHGDRDAIIAELLQVLGFARQRARRALPHRASAGGDLDITVDSRNGAYPVRFRPDAGDWMIETIENVAGDAPRIFVLSDTTVAPLHAESLVQRLRDAGRTVSMHTVAPGEGSKSLRVAETVYEQLLDGEIGRRDLLVAVGGGVVGDLTGFVASTILRGVRFVQVPTTTLAAVDSSVGGKTAVNSSRGKNLVGTFYSPRAVLVASAHLATQDRRNHAAGLVEALKMAVTLDAELFSDLVRQAPRLLDFDSASLMQVLARAVRLKAAVVSRDERERGERAVLNYGHTIGHAIERGENYAIPHGEAVAMGMVAESAWARQLAAEGAAKLRTHETLTAGLQALGAPTRWEDAAIDVDALSVDKKRTGSTVKLPVLLGIGSYEFRDVPIHTVRNFVEARKEKGANR